MTCLGVAVGQVCITACVRLPRVMPSRAGPALQDAPPRRPPVTLPRSPRGQGLGGAHPVDQSCPCRPRGRSQLAGCWVLEEGAPLCSEAAPHPLPAPAWGFGLGLSPWSGRGCAWSAGMGRRRTRVPASASAGGQPLPLTWVPLCCDAGRRPGETVRVCGPHGHLESPGTWGGPEHPFPARRLVGGLVTRARPGLFRVP